MMKQIVLSSTLILLTLTPPVAAQQPAPAPAAVAQQPASPPPAAPQQPAPAPAAAPPADNANYPAQQAYPEQQAYPQQPPPAAQPVQPQPYQQQPGYQQQPYPQQPYPQQPYPQQPYPQQPGYAPYAAPPPYSMGPVQGSNPEFFKMSTPQLEEELDDTGLGGPITFLAIGVPALIIGVPWFVGSLIGADNCNDIADPYDTCGDTYTASLILSGTLIGIGLPFTILGSVFLPKRIAQRRALSNEIDLRKGYGKSAGLDWHLAPLPTRGLGLSYGLVGSF